MSAHDPQALVRQLAAELFAAENRLLGEDRARLVAGGRDSARAQAALREVAAGFVATVGVLLEEAEGVARAGGQVDDHAPPGTPHIIRWVRDTVAAIEDADGALAWLRVVPTGGYTLRLARELPTVEARDHLARSITWALEEHKRRSAEEPGGAVGRGGTALDPRRESAGAKRPGRHRPGRGRDAPGDNPLPSGYSA